MVTVRGEGWTTGWERYMGTPMCARVLARGVPLEDESRSSSEHAWPLCGFSRRDVIKSLFTPDRTPLVYQKTNQTKQKRFYPV